LKMRTVAAVPLGNDSSLLVKQVKFLALGGGHVPTAVAMAKDAGAPTRVIDAILQCKTVDLYTRTAVPAMATSDSDLAAIHNARNIATAFIPLLKNQSVFYRGIDANLMIQAPLRTRLSSLTLGATAFVVGEGAAVPISIVKFDACRAGGCRGGAIAIVTCRVSLLGHAAGRLAARRFWIKC
jgi:hypothetical protein